MTILAKTGCPTRGPQMLLPGLASPRHRGARARLGGTPRSRDGRRPTVPPETPHPDPGRADEFRTQPPAREGRPGAGRLSGLQMEVANSFIDQRTAFPSPSPQRSFPFLALKCPPGSLGKWVSTLPTGPCRPGARSPGLCPGSSPALLGPRSDGPQPGCAFSPLLPSVCTLPSRGSTPEGPPQAPAAGCPILSA